MNRHAYYNEIDSFAAAWLRELIKVGIIADGEVDERSIEDVQPNDLRGFAQCHFFAGIGVWSYALRNAGWSDDSPVWTGSCPCQGFSASGKRGGFSDKRHLWPAWFRLIRECRPDTIFGEQVAGKDGLAWLDVVSADVEGAGYAFGAADLCAAGFGAPHIRQRLWFVADSGSRTRQRNARSLSRTQAQVSRADGAKHGHLPNGSSDGSPACELADPSRSGSGTGLRNSKSGKVWRLQFANSGDVGKPDSSGRPRPTLEEGENILSDGSGPLNGCWRYAEWIYCRDEKYRAIEPGTFPLVNGTPARVGRLRGYGNAIVAEVAQAFIESYREVRP